MKFGKSIGTQQEGHTDLHYVEYKLLKKKIKDVVARLQSSELAEALTANKAFEEQLAAEIVKVNQCFSMRQHQLLERTAKLSEELQARQLAGDSGRSCPAGGSATATRADALRQLVDILQEMDQLRKYAVWNAVGVVKILKKRRKQTSFGIEDSAAERAGWLSRQSFFSGSDFAELHASIESLGHMMVLSEVLPEGEHEGGRLRSQSHQALQQCPICLDTITDMVELSCQHRFCWKCFVLGPIAFQPGEYCITQCPICRRETSQNEEGDEEGNKARTAPLEGAACTQGTPQPSHEGLLTRFLHTYFPDKAADGDKADINTLDVEEEDVGELVKVLLADCNLQRPSGSSGGDAAVSSDFFDTLPQPMRQEKPLRAAQKLQWLQLASSGDPFALDDNMYCSLCSEPLMMEAVVTTPCKHHFHRVCINRVDSPQCPLCNTALPFSWFLPADHPCAEHGFRTVSPQSYQPCFAGGPSKGSCGYPLQRPPPAQLYGANGSMRSYLHRLIPTGSGVESHEDEDNSPNHALQASSHAKMEDPHEEEDESSESDSNSEEEVQEAEPFKRHSRHGSKPPAVYLYSAVGRMKHLGRGRGPSEPQPARQKVTPENSPPEMARSRSTTASQEANGDDIRAPKVQLFTALFGQEG